MASNITKQPKKYSQKIYLFIVYGSLILVLLTIFFVFTYTHYRNNTMVEVRQEAKNICTAVTNSVENQLDNLATISINIVTSNAIKENFREFSTAYAASEQTEEDLTESWEKAQHMRDIITAIIGTYQSASQVNLYTMDGYFVEGGFLPRINKIDLTQMPWFDETFALHGHKYFSAPYQNTNLPASGANQDSRMFISLTRLFLQFDNTPEGIAEVVQDCDKIFALTSELENSNFGTSIYVYNSRGELAYPYTGQDTEHYFSYIDSLNLSPSTPSVINTDYGTRVLMTYDVMEDYEWTTIVIQEEGYVFKSLHAYRQYFIIIATFSILSTLLICFFIAYRLTTPLQRLTATTERITLDRVLDNDVNLINVTNSQIKEITLLEQSIHDMYERLRDTSKEVLLSHSEETKAKLQATQSLVNPHYLYNSLTTISIMAEEEMNEDIIQMCHAISDYLRYITSSNEMLVTLSDEFLNSKHYLDSMRYRHLDDFDYFFEIGDGTQDLMIPKLILQPFLGNAFKHAFDGTPPWIIHVESYTDGTNWTIQISDNGGTLTDVKKEELLHLYKTLDVDEALKHMQLGGMGLKNVYLRLKLLYGDQAIFKIDNSKVKRTIFTIGGPIHLTKENLL